MLESQDRTADVQKQSAAPPSPVGETAKPSIAPAVATANTAGNLKMQNPTSPERSADKRSVQRHANAMKARTGHRRNIRRSNTNG